ncbi:hypothetical protein [Clostridium sp. E02]|uniref:hypothetical protein n=1 Tax=Clostridium sp. E02 TaxID=2487134 RepID=UPI0013DDEBF3|nr:hypothetical protein [Clostridium sp. E02]
MKEKHSYQELYGYFCGMITNGNLDELNGRILGAIPDMGTVTGDIQVKHTEKSESKD